MNIDEVAVASLLLRIVQINEEDRPKHWLWDRIMDCDVPRLREQLSEQCLATMDAARG